MLRCAMQAAVLQTGSGGLFLGIATGANISYAGGKNTTFVQANGIADGVATVADVAYTTTGAVAWPFTKLVIASLEDFGPTTI